MRRGLLYLTVLSLSLAASGCSKGMGGSAGETIGLSSTPIEINAGFADDTRGLDPTGITNIQSFGMSAIWNMGETDENLWFLTEQKVEKEVVDEDARIYKWNIVPSAYWPLTGDLSFFFYTPFNDPQYQDVKFVSSRTGLPGVTFTQRKNVSTHYDFCAGKPIYNRSEMGGALSVEFDHVLSQIQIFANYDGILAPGTFAMIDSIRFENVYGSKTLYFKNDVNCFEWQDETGLTADASYTISRWNTELTTDSLPRMNALNDNHQKIYNKAGVLYLPPQTLPDNAQIRVFYGIYLGIPASPKLASSFESVVAFRSGTTLPMNKVVKLNLTLGVGVTSVTQVNATILDWTDSNNVMNNGNPIEYE